MYASDINVLLRSAFVLETVYQDEDDAVVGGMVDRLKRLHLK